MLERLAPLTGVLFTLLMLAWFFLVGETPDTSDTVGDVVRFWDDHSSRGIAGAICGAIGGAALLWFGGSLRAALRRGEGGVGRLSAVAFAGIIVMAVGLLLFAALEFTLADTVGDVPPGITQTLSVMDSDMFFPLAIGVLTMLLASALVILRTGVLPTWLGWIALALAVLSVTPIGWIAFFGAVLWIGVTGVVLYLGGEAD